MMGSEGSTSPAAAACCAVCGGAAAVYCAADAAALCVPCDAAVHAANLLASRHERVPVSAMAAAVAEASGVYDDLFAPDDVDAASSWPPAAQVHGSPQNGSSSTSFTTSDSGAEGGSLFDLLSDVDLAGGGYLPDGVAPVHHGGAAAAPPLWMHPGMAAWATTAWSPSDAAAAAGVVVPSTGAAAAMVAAAAERVARVQRYREKRKNRRFQKTIRYASRKAYAEARPRIKGRFVKRAAGTATSDNAAGATSDNAGSDAASKFWLSFSDDARNDDGGVGFYVDAAAYRVVPSF